MDGDQIICPTTAHVAIPLTLSMHALSCKQGGFPIKSHILFNVIRDITGSLMDDICIGVGIEPSISLTIGQ
jgi:hypothetical protein